MSDNKQEDEYVDAVAQCLSKLIRNCSVKLEKTPTVYIFTILAEVDSKYVMEYRLLEVVHYVQECMRVGKSPEDLAKEMLLIKFFLQYA